MDKQTASFDWIAWFTTIPGIPAGWGNSPPADQPAAPGNAISPTAPALPLLEAA